MTATFYPINTPLVNYFFYNAPLTTSGPNYPLAGGFIYFFDDNNRTKMLPTFSDVSGSVPVLNPNPLPLGPAGECPLFYLENQDYYIVITDSSGDIQNPIRTIEHYNPADFTPDDVPINNNFVTNGQFAYPIEFWETGDAAPNGEYGGAITQATTVVAWAWQFLQDENTTTKNIVTFNNINSEQVEGNPFQEIKLDSTQPQSGEALKDFSSQLGTVNLFEGETITFSAQMISYLSGNVTVNVYLEKFYGDGGSESEAIDIATFTVTPTRQKFVASITLPTNEDKSIGDGNYLALRLACGVAQTFSGAITNVDVRPGNSGNPVYFQESTGDTIAQILGSSTSILQGGLEANFTPLMYQNGQINFTERTGEIVLFTKTVVPSYVARCDSSGLSVSGYDETSHIPNQRLYSVIGNTYGGAGELVATSQNNVVTVSSGVGARTKTAWTAQTAPVTIATVATGLPLGVSLVRTAFDTVQATWVDEFAPNQTPSSFDGYTPPSGLMSYWTFNYTAQNITVDTVNAGGISTQAIANIQFNSLNASDYQTRIGPHPGNFPFSCLEFAGASTNNSRGQYPNFNSLVIFSVDGAFYSGNLSGTPSVVVPFLSANSIAKNLDVFIQTVAAPFIQTITVNAAPSPSPGNAATYFFYSSSTTDYYGWLNVDGANTDPAIVGRTGTEILISSGDTTTQIAAKITAEIDDLVFNLPGSSDLPDLQPNPSDSLVDWYIFR